MEIKGTIALIVDPQDSLFWGGWMEHLREDGWEIAMFKHPSWVQPDSTSPLPEGVMEANVLMVYGLGAQDWWVKALATANKPTVYITSIGTPNLKLDKLAVVDGFFRYEELLAAVEKVAA